MINQIDKSLATPQAHGAVSLVEARQWDKIMETADDGHQREVIREIPAG